MVVGRRGPVQAAWTPPELAELGELAGADVIVDPAELELDPASEAELDAADHIVKRNLEVLHEFAAREPEGKPRRVVLRFRALPRRRSSATIGSRRSSSSRNTLEPDGRGSVRAVADRRARDAPVRARLSERRLPRAARSPGVPFDEGTGTMPNDGGRVLGEDGAPLPGVYCAGWIKRGPTGVIGTNKKDASETVELLLADADSGAIGGSEASAADVDALLAERASLSSASRAGRRSTPLERALGEPRGRPARRSSTLLGAELLAACTWLDSARGRDRADSSSGAARRRRR